MYKLCACPPTYGNKASYLLLAFEFSTFVKYFVRSFFNSRQPSTIGSVQLHSEQKLHFSILTLIYFVCIKFAHVPTCTASTGREWIYLQQLCTLQCRLTSWSRILAGCFLTNLFQLMVSLTFHKGPPLYCLHACV